MLVFSRGMNGWHGMDVAGEALSPGRPEMLRVAETAGLTAGEAEGIMNEVSDAVARWPEFAGSAGVSERTAEQVLRQLPGI